MSRPIDADEAYKVLSEYYHQRTETQHKALKEALDRVSTVNPIKHGHWTEYHDEYDILFKFKERYACSVCGTSNSYGKSDYCPWCGAKMDEVVE